MCHQVMSCGGSSKRVEGVGFIWCFTLRATLTLTTHTTILSLLTVAMQWLGNVGCSLMYKLCLLSFVSSTSFTTPPLRVFLFDITVYLWDCRTLWGWTEQAMYRNSVWLANVHLNLWIARRALWLLCLDWESVQLKIEEWWKSLYHGVTCFFQPHRNTKSRTLRKGGDTAVTFFCFTPFNLTELLSVSLQVVWTLIPPLLHSKSNSHSTFGCRGEGSGGLAMVRYTGEGTNSKPREPVCLSLVLKRDHYAISTSGHSELEHLDRQEMPLNHLDSPVHLVDSHMSLPPLFLCTVSDQKLGQ